MGGVNAERHWEQEELLPRARSPDGFIRTGSWGHPEPQGDTRSVPR